MLLQIQKMLQRQKKRPSLEIELKSKNSKNSFFSLLSSILLLIYILYVFFFSAGDRMKEIPSKIDMWYSTGECRWTSAFCHFHQWLTWHWEQFVPQGSCCLSEICVNWHETLRILRQWYEKCVAYTAYTLELVHKAKLMESVIYKVSRWK